MKVLALNILLTLGLIAPSLQTLSAAEPSGDKILRQMSDKLAAAKTFRFEATREIDSALLPGISLSGKVHIAAVVQRPDKFAAWSESKSDSRQLIANGQSLTLFDARKNFYTSVPMRKSIDELFTELDEKYGFTPPLAEFALSNPYREFRRQAQVIVSLGRGTIGGGFLGLGGIECERLLLKGKAADAELWIGVKDHLPRKLVATFHRPGNPQVRIRFLTWKLDAKVCASDFAFTPPKGALKIEMWTTSKMQSVGKH